MVVMWTGRNHVGGGGGGVLLQIVVVGVIQGYFEDE